MNSTRTLFLENTYLFAMPCHVTATGTDEHGCYIVLERSIFYPQGGGQPNDDGYISYDQNEIRIIAAKYTDSGIRHYLETDVPKDLVDTEIRMNIQQYTRMRNASYHTAGHWLSQLVLENMQLPLFPVKGHHFPGEAYIEFEGDINCITPDTIEEIRMVMMIDLQTNPRISVHLAKPGDKIFESALLPKNFRPPINKPLRLTQIEGYSWLPCGGTHIEFLREAKSILPVDFYKKGKNIRLRYTCFE